MEKIARILRDVGVFLIGIAALVAARQISLDKTGGRSETLRGTLEEIFLDEIRKELDNYDVNISEEGYIDIMKANAE